MKTKMIAGLVAKLDPEFPVAETLAAVSARPGIEVGELTDRRMLPLTVDAADEAGTKTTTDWLLSLPGVLFVDVVYVNFEELNDEENSENHSIQNELESKTSRCEPT